MSERDYWDARYKAGKTSGHQSHRDWEHSIIRMYVPDYDAVSWLDVGCGDLSFWEDKIPLLFSGIDIAQSVREVTNDERILVLDATADTPNMDILRRDVVLCLNVVYHIMDADRLGGLLENLAFWTKKYLFISNWLAEPATFDDRYQHFWFIEDILPVGLRLEPRASDQYYALELRAQHYHNNLVLYVLERVQ